MGALKINVSNLDGQSWPLVLHQTSNQNSTGWGPGIKFLNASDSSVKWAGIGGMASSGYANNNDLVFYTQAEPRFRMNNNTFYPIGDAIYNLGGPTVRWASVYGINFHGDSAILKAEYALRFTNINTDVYLAANSSDGLFLAVYGSSNSGKSIFIETYDTDIYHRKNGTNYKILTPINGGFYTLTREDVGSSYNIDNLTFNGFFEVRSSSEVAVSGAKPWDGYYGCVNFHDGVCKMQIAGSSQYGFAIRGIQKPNATLTDIPWHTLLTSANYNSYSPTLTGGGASGTWGINISGNANTAGTANYSISTRRIENYHITTNGGNSGLWTRAIAATFGTWKNYRQVIAVSSRHQGNGIFVIGFSTHGTTDSYEYDCRYYGTMTQAYINNWVKCYYNPSTGYFSMWVQDGDYSDCNFRILHDSLNSGLIENDTPVSTIPSEAGNRITIKVNAGDTCHNFGANEPSGSAQVGTLYYQTIG